AFISAKRGRRNLALVRPGRTNFFDAPPEMNQVVSRIRADGLAEDGRAGDVPVARRLDRLRVRLCLQVVVDYRYDDPVFVALAPAGQFDGLFEDARFARVLAPFANGNGHVEV